MDDNRSRFWSQVCRYFSASLHTDYFDWIKGQKDQIIRINVRESGKSGAV
jgi:hypothetical protein